MHISLNTLCILKYHLRTEGVPFHVFPFAECDLHSGEPETLKYIQENANLVLASRILLLLCAARGGDADKRDQLTGFTRAFAV